MCLGAIGVIEATWSESGVPMGRVGGRPACLLYTPDAGIGDTVLVHLGYVVEVLDPDRAADAVALRTRARERSTT